MRVLERTVEGTGVSRRFEIPSYRRTLTEPTVGVLEALFEYDLSGLIFSYISPMV